MNPLKHVVENRRSIEVLEKSNTISQDEILELVQHAIHHTPSAFNAQSVAAMVLFEDSHHKLWDEVTKQILPFVAQEKHLNTISKIDGFKGGNGTVIFLEDTEIGEDLKKRFPLYQDNVKLWGDQGQGFAQHAVWLTLSDAGLSATLQHYNPLIDSFIMDHFDVDKKYQIVAQMPFGKAKSQPKSLVKKNINERVWKK
jgi:predicted oxidoreductase (fatty acid repression mutant protein)